MSTKFRVMFLRDTKGQPVGCLAIGLTKDPGVVKYNLSVLNPEDKFERPISRQLALGRLVEQPIMVTLPSAKPKMHDITIAVMTHLANSKTAPGRAVRAARRWINTPLNLL